MMCKSVRLCSGVAVAALAVFTAFSAVAGDKRDTEALEFPLETKALVMATAAFFDKIEAGAVSGDRKRPVFRTPRLAKKASVKSEASSAPLMLKGKPRHLTGYRINWYPTDRFLGSVDFMGTWDGNRNLVCGYVTWDVSDPAEPKLETVSANYVELGSLEGASADTIHQTLLEANCAFGSIDANFGFFDPAG